MASRSMVWMENVQERARSVHRTRVRPAVADAVLRSFGQVIFCNSSLSGLGILIALFYADVWLATLALLGSFAATMTAHTGNVSIAEGLAGYNGVLVGCGFAIFLKFGEWTWQPVVATGVAGITTTLISVAMSGMSKVPVWTFPFNIVLLCTLTYTLPFDNSSVPDEGAVDFNVMDILMAVPIGVSQIYVVNNWISGMIITISLAIYSPLLAVSCVFGSLVGLATGMAIGEHALSITQGLCGYNPALTACAVYTFFKPTKEALVLLVLSSALTQNLASGLSTAAARALTIPVGTLPFCIAATFTYMLLGQMKGLSKLSVSEEDNSKEGSMAAGVNCSPEQIADSVEGTPIKCYPMDGGDPFGINCRDSGERPVTSSVVAGFRIAVPGDSKHDVERAISSL